MVRLSFIGSLLFALASYLVMASLADTRVMAFIGDPAPHANLAHHVRRAADSLTDLAQLHDWLLVDSGKTATNHRTLTCEKQFYDLEEALLLREHQEAERRKLEQQQKEAKEQNKKRKKHAWRKKKPASRLFVSL